MSGHPHAVTSPRRRRWRPLSSVRTRLSLLVLIAAVPLCAMAATIALQNYRAATDRITQRALLLREAVQARGDATLLDATRTLQGLARSPAIGGDARGCDATLAFVLSLQLDAFNGLAVYGPDGAPRCSARANPARPNPAHPDPASPDPAVSDAAPLAPGRLQALLDRAGATHGLVLGLPGAGAARRSLIPMAYPIAGPASAGRAGILYTELEVDWFGKADRADADAVAWLIDAGGMTAIGPGRVDDLPPPATLARLLGSGDALQAASRQGRRFAYAATPLFHDMRLVVGTPSGREQSAAERALLLRLLLIAGLLAVGVSVVAVGIREALTQPLRRLGAEVRAWRATGRFDAARVAPAPAELRELALSFARATRSLDGRRRELRVAVEQQELLMQEIHHRVKNNLQIIASLLNLQAARIRQPEARAEFQSARDRVRALATLHRHLYSHGEVHTIHTRSFLVELCGQLFQAMGEREGERIALQIEASELQMSSDQAVPLALIVTEAVSNAIKYAFPNARPGHICVTLRTLAGATPLADEAELVIQDDGVGIPAGRVETEHGTRDGIGLQLIRGFARQLGATLDVMEGQGTLYRVRLPLHRERDTLTPAA